MKIITEVKILETDKDFHEIYAAAYSSQYAPIQFGEECVSTEVVREYIKGRRFVDTRKGIDIILGCTKEAGELLELQYEAVEEMEHTLCTLRDKCETLEKNLKTIYGSSFLQRLKYLVTGGKAFDSIEKWYA